MNIKILLVLLLAANTTLAGRIHTASEWDEWCRKHPKRWECRQRLNSTPSPTPTATATATFTPTATATFTPTPTVTATFTPTITPTATEAPTATATATSTPTPTASAAPTMKPWTGGVIALMTSDPDKNGVPLDIGKYNVDFEAGFPPTFRYRGLWKVAEKTKGAYNFATLDATIAKAVEHGQRVGFSFSAGCSSPDWIYTEGAKKYVAHSGVCTMPIPWDTKYQEYFFPFIQELGRRYDSNTAVAYVCIVGFMQQNAMYLGDLDDKAALDELAKQAGYHDVHEALRIAANAIIDQFARAFPRTSIMLMTARVWPDDSGDGSDQKAIKDYGLAHYPNFGIQPGNGLKCQVDPLPSPEPISYPKIAQAIWWVTGEPCSQSYLDPVPSDCSGDKAVRALMRKGVSDSNMAIEMYPGDYRIPGNESAITEESANLIKNIPSSHR